MKEQQQEYEEFGKKKKKSRFRLADRKLSHDKFFNFFVVAQRSETGVWSKKKIGFIRITWWL